MHLSVYYKERSNVWVHSPMLVSPKCYRRCKRPMLLTRHSDKVRSNVLVHSPLLVSKKEMSVGCISRVCHAISTWQYLHRVNTLMQVAFLKRTTYGKQM
jgi:hypothetical protein